jgi:adenylate cyclase
MFKVTFKGKQTFHIDAEREVTLLAAAAKGEVGLNHQCGGHARCGTCRITVEEGAEHLSPMGTAEARVLRILKAGPNERLGCQAWAKGDVVCKVD